jgi:aminopeptidase-like protein
VYQRETFRTLTWGQNVGDTLPVFNCPENVLAISTPTIPGNGQQIRNLPAWAGQVWIQAQTPSNTNDFEVQILDQSINGGLVYDDFTDTKGHVSKLVTLPRNQCEVVMINHNAAAQTVSFYMVIAPPE